VSNPGQGIVKEEKMRTPDVLPGQLVKKMQRALPTLQHLQEVGQPMGMEYPRDDIHICRVIVHHGNDERREGLVGLHASDFLVLAVPHSTP
jgi:hypothetical protein